MQGWYQKTFIISKDPKQWIVEDKNGLRFRFIRSLCDVLTLSSHTTKTVWSGSDKYKSYFVPHYKNILNEEVIKYYI